MSFLEVFVDESGSAIGEVTRHDNSHCPTMKHDYPHEIHNDDGYGNTSMDFYSKTIARLHYELVIVDCETCERGI